MGLVSSSSVRIGAGTYLFVAGKAQISHRITTSQSDYIYILYCKKYCYIFIQFNFVEFFVKIISLRSENEIMRKIKNNSWNTLRIYRL
jgi:hypothetical protein